MEINKKTIGYTFWGILIIVITIVISLLSIYVINKFNTNDTLVGQLSNPLTNFIAVNYLYLGLLFISNITVLIKAKRVFNKELYSASLFILALLTILALIFTGVVFM